MGRVIVHRVNYYLRCSKKTAKLATDSLKLKTVNIFAINRIDPTDMSFATLFIPDHFVQAVAVWRLRMCVPRFFLR